MRDIGLGHIMLGIKICGIEIGSRRRQKTTRRLSTTQCMMWYYSQIVSSCHLEQIIILVIMYRYHDTTTMDAFKSFVRMSKPTVYHNITFSQRQNSWISVSLTTSVAKGSSPILRCCIQFWQARSWFVTRHFSLAVDQKSLTSVGASNPIYVQCFINICHIFVVMLYSTLQKWTHGPTAYKPCLT